MSKPGSFNLGKWKQETKKDACIIVAAFFAAQIFAGKLSPYHGAREIWNKVSHEYEGPHSDLLTTFVGSASEIEDLPGRTQASGMDSAEYKKELEEGIVKAAKINENM